MLKELFAEAAGVIFAAADDIPQAVTIRRTVPGVYNPATGKTGPATVTDDLTRIQVRWDKDEV